MSGQQDDKAPKPTTEDAKPHKVDEQTQEQAAEERADNPGYD